jgi:DNA-binding NarL/FixJ family response regulator
MIVTIVSRADAVLVEPAPRITCLLVDDHPVILKALAAILKDDGIEIVGRAERGSEALAMLESRRPAVMLLDLQLPDMTGIEVIQAAAKAAPDTACLVYTGYADWAHAREALDVGGRGVVSKEAPFGDVARAIAMVASGQIYLDPMLGAELAADRLSRPHLSHRERDVLRCLAEGLTNDEIGLRLHLSGETVRGYVRKATARLGARNRTQAVAAAVRDGLIR